MMVVLVFLLLAALTSCNEVFLARSTPRLLLDVFLAIGGGWTREALLLVTPGVEFGASLSRMCPESSRGRALMHGRIVWIGKCDGCRYL